MSLIIRYRVIPTRTERHALAQSRRPMGMTRYSLRSENPGMSQPSRGLVLGLHSAPGQSSHALFVAALQPEQDGPDDRDQDVRVEDHPSIARREVAGRDHVMDMHPRRSEQEQ